MHFKLIAPGSGSYWEPQMSAGVLTTPQNEGHEPQLIVRRLDELGASGHSCEVIDGEALTPEELSHIYAGEAIPAAGNRCRIRQAFGSRKHTATAFGTNIPALIVFDSGRAVDVFPHQREDGSYSTIRDYLDRL